MVSVSYSHRLIVDYEFIKWLSSSGEKVMAITRMLRINVNSKEHPRENVVILEEDFEKLCREGIIKDKDILRGCLMPINLKEKLDGVGESLDVESASEELKRLVIGVLLTGESPFQSILLTTNSFKQKYNTDYDSFLSKIKKLEIKDEKKRIIIL